MQFRHFLPTALLAALLASPNIVRAQLPEGYAEGADKYFRKALETTRAKFSNPALGGCLVIGGKIMAHGATGYRDLTNTNYTVTDNDRFPIGSVTKPFTSFVAARVIQAMPNKIQWTTPIKSFFQKPASSGNGTGLSAGVDIFEYALEDLSDFSAPLSLSAFSHASCGLNNFSGQQIYCPSVNGVEEVADKSPISSYWMLGRDEFAAKILRLPLGNPGKYNNAAPVMIATMLQKASGQTYEKLANQYVIAPLGSNAKLMNEITDAEVSARAFPVLHIDGGNSTSLDVVKKYNTDWARYHLCHPSGGLMISPKDMGKWFIELMPNSPDRKNLLTDDNLSQYLGGSTTKDTRIRGGWYNVAIKDKIPSTGWVDADNALWHNGSHGSSYCEAFVFPDDNFAFCSMTNIGGNRGTSAVQDMSRHCMALNYQKAIVPLFDGYNPTFSIEGEGAPQTDLNNWLKDINFLTGPSISGSKPTLVLSNLPKYINANQQMAVKVETVAVALPQNMHNLKAITLYKLVGTIPSQSTYEKVQWKLVTTKADNIVFELSPAYTGSKLKLEFEKVDAAQNVQIAEIIVR